MEGYFWRFTDARSGRVIVALCGISRAADGDWATVALAGHPGRFARQIDVQDAGADFARLGVWAGERAFAANSDRVRVDLGPDAQLDLHLRDCRHWNRSLVGGSGAAHLIPGLNQYWHPHVLGGRAEGRVILGDEVIDLVDADVYAEKNWGRGGFPTRWHWGQAQAFERRDVCVAFAGGDVEVGRATLRATALVVRLGTDVIRLGNPVLAPVTADADGERWALRGRGPRWSVELEGGGARSAAHILHVPVPAERRSVPAALEHLAARVRLVVRHRGRVRFAGESELAGLEVGSLNHETSLSGS
jgi:hypothetical protein